MKQIFNSWWKIAIIAIVVGIALIALGFALSARGVYVYFDGGRVRFASNAEQIFIEEYDLESFDEISVMANSANIELIESTSFGLELRLPAHADKPEWSIADGKLSVDARVFDGNFIFMSFDSRSYYIKVYVPKGHVLEHVELNTSSGDILLSNVSAENIAIQARSGTIEADTTGCTNVHVKSESGDVKLFGDTLPTADIFASATSGDVNVDVATWQKLTVQSNSGDVEITGEPNGVTSVDSMSGQVTLTLNGNQRDFSYDISTRSGTVQVGGQSYNDSARSIDRDAKNTIEVRASSGDVRVDFR